MSDPRPSRFTRAAPTNRLLAALPAHELRAVQPHLEPVELPSAQVFYEVSRIVEHAYFLERGVASMTAPMEDAPSVEIATVGPEGMVGIPLVLGADQMASRCFMQVSGARVRIAAGAFRDLNGRCPELNRLLLRYTLALTTLMGQTAVCNRVHSVEKRCARWLLMTHDRVSENSFQLTQDFLAQMLGVRRPTVSIAAGMLAKAGLISYVRGQLTVHDRAGLEAASCECYRIIAAEFDRLIGATG
jgi:CRP-like cAMP-binding protein